METKPGNYSDLDGKTAVVTGGSHGVGSGVCRELARQGVRVVVNGRDPDAISAVSDAIIASGGTAVGVPADVTDADEVRRLRERAEDAFGPIDIVCACAGGQGDPIPIGELDVDGWRAGIDVNLTSAFLTLREFVPSMTERRSGAIVTMASTAGRIASPSSPAYAAGKAGLIMLSRQTALQVAAADVRVNTIALGPVFEGKPIPAEIRERVAQLHPLRRTGSWADVESAVAFLVSDASAWITGTTLDVSGGRIML
ncbi:MAG: short-chain dehydrogenase/reductase [Pseudonocardiales bacterium]|nr:short-chain dehydrogenase/reductase [Pseudonocardiales bacterium]